MYQSQSSPIDVELQQRPAPAIALIDRENRLLAVTPAFASVVGYAPADLCGSAFERITHEPDIETDNELAIRLFSGEIDSYESTRRCVHRNGHLVRILLTFSVARDASGAIAYAVSQMQALDEEAAQPIRVTFQPDHEPNDQIERIKNAMFW
jgi:PAS domain S-box-containing protein